MSFNFSLRNLFVINQSVANTETQTHTDRHPVDSVTSTEKDLLLQTHPLLFNSVICHLWKFLQQNPSNRKS